MATSFYDLGAASFLQTVSTMAGFLDRAATHYAGSPDLDDLVSERLFFDMAPLHFHVEAACHHPRFGLEAVKTGVFDPPGLRGRVPFADPQAMARESERALHALRPTRFCGRTACPSASGTTRASCA